MKPERVSDTELQTQTDFTLKYTKVKVVYTLKDLIDFDWSFINIEEMERFYNNEMD